MYNVIEEQYLMIKVIIGICEQEFFYISQIYFDVESKFSF